MEISTTTICVIGGCALAAGIIIAICAASAKSKKPAKLSDIVNSTTDDQLVVDHLTAKDLASWFTENNPDKKYTNIILYPNEKNIEKLNLPKNIEIKSNDDNEKLIIQVIYDENNNKFILFRSVMFETISEKLFSVLEENDGMVIVD